VPVQSACCEYAAEVVPDDIYKYQALKDGQLTLE
jgi:hypothetical protein